MEEKLVKGLLELYKEQGINLYGIVDDPMFIHLPLPAKIKLLQQHAQMISEGTHNGMTRKDIRDTIWDVALYGAIGAGAAGIGAVKGMQYFKGSRPNVSEILGSAVLGAAVGGATSLVGKWQTLINRNAMVKRVHELRDDPSESNAIKLMALRNVQKANTGESPLIAKARQLLGDVPTKTFPHLHNISQFNTMQDGYLANLPYKDGHDDMTYVTAYKDLKHKIEQGK